jgi:hypothetical protein
MTGRWTHHRYMLRRGKHKTKALQDLWTEDGEDAFTFEVLEYCKDVIVREQHWLDVTPDRLNTSPTAITGHSSQPSERRKLAAVKRWQNPAYRAKHVATWKSKASKDILQLIACPKDMGYCP